MVRKIAALAGAGALLLATAGPAFGCTGWWCVLCRDRNTADVVNNANAEAYTGGNSQNNVAQVTHGGGVDVDGADGNRTMYTGDADAYAGALVVANVDVSCCEGDSCLCLETNNATVRNGSRAIADTGLNGQDDVAQVTHGGGVSVDGGKGTRYMSTGGAISEARAWSITNVSWGW